MLPKLTGLELLKKIRSQPGLERLPVIVLSNTYLSNLVQEAWKAGATKCLSKADCAPKQMSDVVRSLFPQAPPASLARNQAPDPGPAPDSSASVERDGSGLTGHRLDRGRTFSLTFEDRRSCLPWRRLVRTTHSGFPSFVAPLQPSLERSARWRARLRRQQWRGQGNIADLVGDLGRDGCCFSGEWNIVDPGLG